MVRSGVYPCVYIYIYILFIRLYDDNSLQWSESDIVKVYRMYAKKEFEKKKPPRYINKPHDKLYVTHGIHLISLKWEKMLFLRTK